ncbi:TlpA family protein disulfide reductase [Chitinibacter bivalviorum]|uniref:TlpA family protein disulfide reductase n=1 Tax=Chitinibacter bivalviorum TaxID=2739434 RepID=A0A7H9BLP2_9NEIS|nr:TlpA disulfide reductase family protein [Chitinibacter bivalviorum]QLG89208.1 TlpA family protein disulfide reductase [Chitinibacter bivalviorum]
MKTRLQVISVSLLAVVLGGYLLYSQQEQLPTQAPMTTLDGQQIKLSDYQGKVVLVNFWATSCTGCMQEMPELKKLQLKYGADRFQTVAIAMSYDNIEYIKNYKNKEKIPFKIIYDADGKIAQSFGGVTLTPTNFLIGKDGKLLKKYIGIPDYTEIISKL